MSQIMCSCGKKLATIHVTEIVDGEKKELHLCEDCAQKQKVLFSTIESMGDLKEIFSGLVSGASQGENDSLKGLQCPECGITYEEFQKTTRFGCPNDYEVFREAVDPLLERIHGTTEHQGKAVAAPALARPADRLIELRAELRKAVAEEAYEHAARIRDQIYELKKDLADEGD
jgi:protein arginine kinase activator